MDISIGLFKLLLLASALAAMLVRRLHVPFFGSMARFGDEGLQNS